MTAGNDVIFPGCHQTVKLDRETANFISTQLSSTSDVIEFAYMALNAWGEPGTVGTIVVVEDMTAISSHDTEKASQEQSRGDDNIHALVVFGGVARFSLQSIADDMRHARIEMFSDQSPTEAELTEIENLEQRLVLAMKDIVTLSIKIYDDEDQTREEALEETLRRVELFYTQNDSSKNNVEHKNAHWMLSLSPDYRRELLSFIVIDMLSVSFMDRRALLQSTDASLRFKAALKALEPFIKELAAKGAIVGALGREDGDSSANSVEDSLN